MQFCTLSGRQPCAKHSAGMFYWTQAECSEKKKNRKTNFVTMNRTHLPIMTTIVRSEMNLILKRINCTKKRFIPTVEWSKMRGLFSLFLGQQSIRWFETRHAHTPSHSCRDIIPKARWRVKGSLVALKQNIHVFCCTCIERIGVRIRQPFSIPLFGGIEMQGHRYTLVSFALKQISEEIWVR